MVSSPEVPVSRPPKAGSRLALGVLVSGVAELQYRSSRDTSVGKTCSSLTPLSERSTGGGRPGGGQMKFPLPFGSLKQGGKTIAGLNGVGARAVSLRKALKWRAY